MSKPFVFEKPLGMRDTLPFLYETKQRVRENVLGELTKWGYATVETPTLEYYETVGKASATLERQLFKLLDQQGNTLVLRPDMTAPIARLVAANFYDESFPQRLCYAANVYRAQQREGGRPAEFAQIGVELIGDSTVSADAEVIALMIAALKSAGLEQFQIAIGHVGFVNGLLIDVLGNEERAETLRRFLYKKNYVGYREHVKSLSLSSIDKNRLLGLLKLRGERDTLEAAKQFVRDGEGTVALAELEKLWDALESYQVTEHIKFDLNLVMHMSYYTGVVFESYGNNLGVPLGSGGRYDELLAKFHCPKQATGFGIRLDLLTEAIGKTDMNREKTCIIYSNERRDEAIALATKKRVNGETVVLQDLLGVEDVDRFSEQFSNVIFCIGKAKQEEDDK